MFLNRFSSLAPKPVEFPGVVTEIKKRVEGSKVSKSDAYHKPGPGDD